MKTKLAENKILPSLQPKEELVDNGSKSKEQFVGMFKSDASIQKHCISPSMIQKLTDNYITTLVEKGIGTDFDFSDMTYADNGALICKDRQLITSQVNILIKTTPFTLKELESLQDGQTIISSFSYDYFTQVHHEIMAKKKLNAIAYNFIQEREENDTLSAANFEKLLLQLIFATVLNKDLRTAIQTSPAIIQGIFYYKGILTNKEIATHYSLPFRDILELCWNWN